MKVAWVTDIHLNFLNDPAIDAFCGVIAEPSPDALLITGDIAEAISFESILSAIELQLQIPIYFVLGNHDFYFGSIAEVRAGASALSAGSQHLVWMNEAGVVRLTDETCLVGHDSWADGRLGAGRSSRVELTDYVAIDDFIGLDRVDRFAKMASLGDEAADCLRVLLPEALEQYRHVIVLTHAPPFRDACWHEGAISDDEYLPHFSCKALGEALAEVMRARSDRSMTVLCGHTHGAGEVRVLPNLFVRTGGAKYGRPHLQDCFEVA